MRSTESSNETGEGEQTAVDLFGKAHEDLDASLMETVEALTDAAASLKVFGEPDRGALRSAIGASAESIRALETCLGLIAEAVGDEELEAGASSGGASDAAGMLEVVRELEPPISERSPVGAARARPGEVGMSPGDGAESSGEQDKSKEPGGPPGEAAGDLRETTAMAKLMAPYGIAVNLESDLFRDRVRRPYLLRAFKQTWSEVRFMREREAGAGLVERLQQLFPTVRAAVEGEESDADRDERPWSSEDRAALAGVRETFEELNGLDDEEVQRRHRESWLRRVERWLETAESEPEAVAHMTEMLTRFATDIPQDQDARVQTAAQRMMALEGVPDQIVTRLEQALAE